MVSSIGSVFSLIFLLLCFSSVKSQCPSAGRTILPCHCSTFRDGEQELTCEGPVGLVKLTTILRNEMCGRTIDRFKLTLSDVEYLPSNLFFKIVVKDIQARAPLVELSHSLRNADITGTAIFTDYEELLQISFTYISHFTKAGHSAFYGLEPHLRSLSMRRGKLVDNLEWQKIGDLYALTYLDLSFNTLTRIPAQWFDHPPPNLLSLILKGNKIKTLESGALRNMHELIELDLSDNQISTITRDVFPLPGNALIFLRLNDNELQTLPDDLFDEMLGLRRIYLDNNQLETIPERVWTPVWGDLEILDLRGNILNCNSTSVDWISELKAPLHLYGSC